MSQSSLYLYRVDINDNPGPLATVAMRQSQGVMICGFWGKGNMKVREGTHPRVVCARPCHIVYNMDSTATRRLARGSVVCFHDVLLTAVIEGAGGWIFFG